MSDMIDARADSRKRSRFGTSPTLRRHPRERACEEIKDLILRSALQRASRRMEASPCRASILRDARKSALLRMRSELFHTLESGDPVTAAEYWVPAFAGTTVIGLIPSSEFRSH